MGLEEEHQNKTEFEISDFCNIHSEVRILDARGCSKLRKAASSVGLTGERCAPRRSSAGPLFGRSSANPTLLVAFLTSKASPSIQNPDFGVDIAKIRNPKGILQNLRPAIRPVREAVIKSAASAASPEGFASRDPVGR